MSNARRPAARPRLGRGPTIRAPAGERLDPLAAYFIVAAAIPLAFLLLRRRRSLPAGDLLTRQADDDTDADVWRSRQRPGRHRVFGS